MARPHAAAAATSAAPGRSSTRSGAPSIRTTGTSANRTGGHEVKERLLVKLQVRRLRMFHERAREAGPAESPPKLG
jgi:hypothetical protein